MLNSQWYISQAVHENAQVISMYIYISMYTYGFCMGYSMCMRRTKIAAFIVRRRDSSRLTQETRLCHNSYLLYVFNLTLLVYILLRTPKALPPRAISCCIVLYRYANQANVWSSIPYLECMGFLEIFM